MWSVNTALIPGCAEPALCLASTLIPCCLMTANLSVTGHKAAAVAQRRTSLARMLPNSLGVIENLQT